MNTSTKVLNYTSISSIVSKSKLLPKTKKRQGVYFLLKNNVIVYVGSAYDYDARLQFHIRNKRKRFDSEYLIEFKPDETKYIKDLELKYICDLKPVYNFTGNPDYHNGKKEVLRTFLNEWKSADEVSLGLNFSKIDVLNVVFKRETKLSLIQQKIIIKKIMTRYSPSKNIPDYFNSK